MPDDIIAEQTETKPDNPVDEVNAFQSEDVDDGTEGLEHPEKVSDKDPEKDADKDVDVKSDKDAKEADGADDKDEKKDPDKEDDDDEDEDIKRGKELREEQERVEAQRKQQEADEKQRKSAAGSYDPVNDGHDAEAIEFFSGVLPKNLFPPSVKLKDGRELDFASIIADEPELPIMMSVIANNIVKQLIANNYLATVNDINDIGSRFDEALFMRTLTNKNDGVPEATKILKGGDFRDWFTKQTPEIQALRKSSDPYDHIRLVKRFMNQSGLDDSKKKTKEIDSKRKESKKNFDAIHKTTARPKAGKPSSSADPREEMLAGFTEKDDDDDFYA